MLNAREFAEAMRRGVERSGLGAGRPIQEAGYVSLAGSVLEYLRANLEISVPVKEVADALREGRENVRCTWL